LAPRAKRAVRTPRRPRSGSPRAATRARGWARRFRGLPATSLGLRPRLLAALVLTSAVTIGVAALALLSPLENRLKRSGESSVIAAVATARHELHEVDIVPATGMPDPNNLRATLSILRKQAGAQAWIVNTNLEPMSRGAPADFNVPTYDPQVRQAFERRAPVASLRGSLFVVAQSVKIGPDRYALVVIKRLNYVASAVGVVEGAFLDAAIAGLGTAILLGIVLAATLVRRLRRLRDAARGLERALGAPLGLKAGRDEIGELARTLQRMQSRLAHHEAALRAFVATASHELRTPLASLDGMLELIEDDLAADRLDLDDARERTARAREQAHRLANLASDLLDLSRLDAEVSLRSEPVELSEMARAVVAELELRATERHVALRVHAPAEPAWVNGDPGALARIVRILLDNALRFSPAGSAIDAEVSTHAAWATLVVRDRGPGVPSDERELIFERFRRGSQTAGQGGFGLGLAIGRELAQRMGGTLELLPARPGGGASFALRLPVAPLEYVPAVLAPNAAQEATVRAGGE
jgi:signal transduction histidine kinase